MSAGAGGAAGTAAPIAMKEVLSVRIVCIVVGWWLLLVGWWLVGLCWIHGGLFDGCFDSAFLSAHMHACVSSSRWASQRVPWRICGVEWKSFFGGKRCLRYMAERLLARGATRFAVAWKQTRRLFGRDIVDGVCFINGDACF